MSHDCDEIFANPSEIFCVRHWFSAFVSKWCWQVLLAQWFLTGDGRQEISRGDANPHMLYNIENFWKGMRPF